ncbi:MAG: LysM peptidoglycan-binding domain-containing protein [Oscillospiraceae bacterium]|jgi:nucleoid-associated protein YgaU|nr:LysM peptidoglycan-binding domain-containing protein [Oscillospiraceae bacterium]
MAATQFWLTANGEKDKLRFPIVPETYPVQDNANLKSIKIIGLGEVSIPQPPPARTVSWKCFFPARHVPGAVRGMRSPQAYIKQIDSWKDKGTKVHLIVTNGSLDLYGYVDSFVWEKKDGGHVHYNLRFRESPNVTVRRIGAAKASTGKTPARAGNLPSASAYTVKKGDCLWTIAQRFLGSGARWKEIYQLNTGQIKKASLIYPGQVLRLPAR